MSNTKGRATEALFEQLHGLLTDSMIAQLAKYKEKGEEIPASFLAQCIKFLKDNGIDTPARENKKIDTLAGELGDLDLDDVEDIGAAH